MNYNKKNYRHKGKKVFEDVYNRHPDLKSKPTRGIV